MENIPAIDNIKQTNKRYSIGSLYQWVLINLIIVTLPLIFAIIYAVFAVTSYTEQSQKTLFKTVNTTESSRLILEKLVSMERSIRQYQVLEETEIFYSYQEQRAQFISSIESLQIYDLDPNLAAKLETLQHNENLLFQTITVKIKNNHQKLEKYDLDAFDSLTKQARLIIDEGEIKLGIEASSLYTNADHVRKNLVYLALASISLALFLAFLFVHFLTRPIKEIGMAIRNLGNKGFKKKIVIHGPNDLFELGQYLEWLRQRLDRLEYEKQQFIRNISHELKTPLATLKEGTDLLADNVVGELNTEQQEIIELMKMGNININDLVQNLLEYQRALSAKISLNYSVFRMSTLIEKIIEDYQLLLRSKNIKVISNPTNTNVNADFEKLRIIISNLFSNAVKFSPENSSISLKIHFKNNIVQILIEDQGPGIPKEIQHLIFKDFYKGSTPLSWKVKGTGLGLALVKHYINTHKGSIKLLPSKNEYCGARFYIQIPQNKEANL